VAESRAARVTRYLERHTAWMRAVLAELDALAAAMDGGDVGSLLEEQGRRTREAEHFLREHTGLLREWDGGAGAPEEDRAAVRALAAEAGALAERLTGRYEALLDASTAARSRNRAALDTLRRGRDMMRKYRPGGDGADYLDRKA